MKVFTPEQMRAFDRAAVETYHIPSIVLMENAALRVVEFLEAKFAPLRGKRVAVLCGKGNNGGDGFAIARHLNAVGCEVWMILTADPAELKGDARINYDSLSGIPRAKIAEIEVQYGFSHRGLFYEIRTRDQGQFKLLRMVNFGIVIDAILGTGARGEINDEFISDALVLAQLLGEWKTPLVAVDIPSGLDGHSGQAGRATPRPDYTITFAAPKGGMLVRDGLKRCGEIWVGDIGVPTALMNKTDTGAECTTRDRARALLPHRSIDAHKGDAGRVLMIGGSVGMSGAIALASHAALKVGAGLCIAAVPGKVLSTFAASVLEATSHPLPCDERGRLVVEAADELGELWKNVQVVAIGPGISRSQSTLELVRRVVRECPQPLVIDADALYALRDITDEVKARTADTILTPHPGEMTELMHVSADEVRDRRFEIARECAEKYGAVVVLKGARSLVALPTQLWGGLKHPDQGEALQPQTFVNLSGNSGMATGGSGDALTGTIAGLLAQIKEAANATQLGVYLHGLAGDLCFQIKGNGLIAGDIVDALPLALRDLERDDSAVDVINGRLRRLR